MDCDLNHFVKSLKHSTDKVFGKTNPRKIVSEILTIIDSNKNACCSKCGHQMNKEIAELLE